MYNKHFGKQFSLIKKLNDIQTQKVNELRSNFNQLATASSIYYYYSIFPKLASYCYDKAKALK